MDSLLGVFDVFEFTDRRAKVPRLQSPSLTRRVGKLRLSREVVDSRLGETRLRLMVQDKLFRVDQYPQDITDAVVGVLGHGNG